MDSNVERLDAVVVGGGPAGAICALELANRGFQVALIFNKAGSATSELVSGRARRLIEEIVKKPLLGLVRGIEVHETISLWNTPYPLTWNAIRSPWGAGVSINRSDFDSVLREIAHKAGARILSDVAVQKIERQDGRWKIYLRQHNVSVMLDACFLGVATGRSRVPWLHRMPREMPSAIAAVARLTSRTPKRQDALCLEATDTGWWYSLPDVRGGQFVGYYTSLEHLRQSKFSLHDFFFKQLGNTRLLGGLRPCSTIGTQVAGQLANIQTYDEICGEGWISIGDAAFAPDPLSGMGIEFATESALFGAHVIMCLEKASSYESWVKDCSQRHYDGLRFYLTA
jgi:flavin-dependent dehydrogenase